MVVPAITALPTAPTRGDAPADYSSKADTFTAALPPFSVQVNTAVAWMGDTMASTLDYKNAAAGSATAAASSAASAAAQVPLAAAQVTLATNQANNAAASASSAQVAAAAAGAAAGLPSFNGKDGLDVLQIKSDKSGVQWGKAGQSVGDILVTTRLPGSTYAQTNRVSYLQSAYPDLYALLGAVPDTDRSVVTNASLNSSFPSDTVQPGLGFVATNGSIIVVVLNSPFGFCYTSSDGGVTWTRRSTPFSNGSSQIGFNNGVFVVTSQGTNNTVYTSSDGINWTARNIPSTLANAGVRVINGLFLVYNSSTSTYYTSPDGITWTTRTSFPTISQGIIYVNNYLVAMASSNTTFFYTTDGVTWLSFPVTAIGSTWYPAHILYRSNTYFWVSQAADGGLYTSTSLTGPWTKQAAVFLKPDGSFDAFSGGAASLGNDCLAFMANTGNIWISNDLGLTWSLRSATNFNSGALGVTGKFLWFGGNSFYTLPYRSYDPSTSFITPKASAQPAPLVTYIKGKLA